MKFEIGPGVQCDLDILADSRALIQANSGGGKSWCIRRILEQSFGHIQHFVIDPEGEFASLRERYDYVLAAKEGGDTAADPRTAALLARRLLELKASAILDIYELRAHERVRFVRHFLDALINAPKALWHPALVIVDEAHVYCPQKGDAESASAVIDLATRGRKRGFCAILATQRLAKLHKDAAAECNNKLIGRTGLDVDMRRASEELGFMGRDEQRQLRALGEGDFFAFGPALSKVVAQVHVGGVQTTHPKAGARMAFTAPPPTSTVKALLPKLSDLPAEVERTEKDMATLRRELTDARRELTAAKKTQALPDESTLQRRVDLAVAEADRGHAAAIRQGQQERKKMERVIGDVSGTLSKLSEHLATTLNGAVEAPTSPAIPRREGPKSIGVDERSPPIPRPESSSPEPTNEEALDGPESRILNAIAWFEALSITEPEQPAVAFLAGYTYGGGGFNNPRGRLKSRGLVSYLPGNRLALTDAGRSAAEPQEVPMTNEALQVVVMSVLEGPHKRILQPLLDVWPDGMTNEDNAEAAGYAPNTGGHNNPRGRLKKMGLIEYPQAGYLRARSLLFPENLA